MEPEPFFKLFQAERLFRKKCENAELHRAEKRLRFPESEPALEDSSRLKRVLLIFLGFET